MNNSDDQLGNPPEHNPVLTRTSAQTNQNLNWQHSITNMPTLNYNQMLNNNQMLNYNQRHDNENQNQRQQQN